MEPDKPASKPNHVLRNNLLLVVGMAAVLGVLTPATDGGSAFLFAALYGGQVFLNLILGVIRLVKSTPGQSAAPYFLSALLVLLIGFGACSVMVLGILGNMH
ncbi:hypothetical protein [Hymenobacter sediminicola]|uniref:Uncharacterized protein n=1 Tax=Hymenobacter sediminicola TaxID=2761579 RepID=A0A7G7WBJ4_9BACT|nr:hypothetical protein [Hymenobacter sediminicola]QNH63737.1 hypothetical protein H4317_08070 [Hymenobacter sediminicola]